MSNDPTTLILVDEADRLHMNSLEQIRSIFDEGTAGLALIGMPGIEKRIVRFPQFYSRLCHTIGNEHLKSFPGQEGSSP